LFDAGTLGELPFKCRNRSTEVLATTTDETNLARAGALCAV
jgi:hypothetical protein